jgi:hypothetical protein
MHYICKYSNTDIVTLFFYARPASAHRCVDVRTAAMDCAQRGAGWRPAARGAILMVGSENLKRDLFRTFIN